ncbi:hypothetical protein SISNIDRAFT_458280 [Sistotremastrum niveocremeum HHB9708]|uniref:Uncharacterized protein n=2 Tax=Sistotremastraceae TaxID=3402574 RepID=A0A164QTR0_9AGAM|nr:hypothetical protein SISNIDRAFT_458280 [Sistotremastrum niveocremeum HHB9708]KZT34713.1 hypothetical protein SISSUDRAFT_1052402 [Sistotremastrum suecicum HHB10207 ss-3]
MFSLVRPLALRRAPLPLYNNALRAAAPSFNSIRIRTVASTVSGKPGSQSLGHAVTNAREEAGNTASDVAKTIAGSNMAQDATPSEASFTNITGAIASQVPQPVMVLGLAGALPYLGTSISSIYLARQAGIAASGGTPGVDPNLAIAILNDCLHIQVTYGAVLLSFLGALHWGLEFAGYGGRQGYPRLLLGLTPVLIAWPTLALSPPAALLAQWVGFTGLWWADQKTTTAGWAPRWFSQYRFYLSILIGTCMIGTVAGASFLGPVGGHSPVHHNLEVIRAERRKLHAENQGETYGDVESVSTGEEGDAYVRVQKRKEGDSDE